MPAIVAEKEEEAPSNEPRFMACIIGACKPGYKGVVASELALAD